MAASINFLILFGALFWFVYGLGNLLEKKPTSLVIFQACVVTGFNQLNIGLYIGGVYQILPHLDGFSVPFLFMLGPSFMALLQFIILQKEPQPIGKINLIPAFFGILALIPYYLKSADYKQNIDELMQNQLLSSFANGDWAPMLLYLVYAIGTLHFFGYMFVFSFQAAHLWNRESFSKTPVVLHFSLIQLSLIIGSLLAIYGQIVLSHWPLQVGGLVLTTVAIWLFLLDRFYETPLSQIKKESTRLYYKNSNLAGIDSKTLKVQIACALNKDLLYQDDKFDRQTFATALGISSHQLSQFLNMEMGTSFYELITVYRVDEAKRLLQNEPGLNVLQIAYQVGFKSKSSFYQAFNNQVGESPLSYRKRFRNNV